VLLLDAGDRSDSHNEWVARVVELLMSGASDEAMRGTIDTLRITRYPTGINAKSQFPKLSCRNIAFTLTDQRSKRVMACLHHFDASSVHRAPPKVRLRDGLNSIVGVLLQCVGFIACGLELDIHFDIRTLDVHIRPLETIRYSAFRREDVA
jgi:hypothetical protein